MQPVINPQDLPPLPVRKCIIPLRSPRDYIKFEAKFNLWYN
jgi:hypothetical protein